jgi:hypothetical protein
MSSPRPRFKPSPAPHKTYVDSGGALQFLTSPKELSASRLDVGVPDLVMVRTSAEARLQDVVDDLTH